MPFIQLRVAILIAAAGGAVSCASTQSKRPCPDSPNHVCITDQECEWDRELECQRCHCGPTKNEEPQRMEPGPKLD